jgi:hypothetical protein
LAGLRRLAEQGAGEQRATCRASSFGNYFCKSAFCESALQAIVNLAQAGWPKGSPVRGEFLGVGAQAGKSFLQELAQLNDVHDGGRTLGKKFSDYGLL